MTAPIRCLLLNYDGSTYTLIRRYLRQAGCQELMPATGSLTDRLPVATALTDADLVVLHLSSPEESVREDLASVLSRHPGVVITSPFPQHLFTDLFTQPFAFLTEPFTYKQFHNCLNNYRPPAR